MTRVPARKQNAHAEKKRKMVARSETGAEDRTVPGKKKRKNDVTALSVAEGDEQDTQSFVLVRVAEAKKSCARCVSPMLHRFKDLFSPILVGFVAMSREVGVQVQMRPRGQRLRVLIQRRNGRGAQFSARSHTKLPVDPTAVRRGRGIPSSSQISGSVHTSTSTYIISNRLDSAEDDPLPVTANKMTRYLIRSQANQPQSLNPLVHRPKPTASDKLSAKDKRPTAPRKLKQRCPCYALL